MVVQRPAANGKQSGPRRVENVQDSGPGSGVKGTGIVSHGHEDWAEALPGLLEQAYSVGATALLQQIESNCLRIKIRGFE